MEHLGKVFREFRTSGKYSLKEAAGESCSTSQLSRFELGESDLAVSRFFEILDNIHVTIENFMDKARDFQNHEHVALMAQIIPLYYSNDIAGFQKLQKEQLEKANKDLTANKEYLESVSAITEVLIALAISQNGGMPTNAYAKVAGFIKPLVKSTRYANGDIVAMPYPFETNAKWPKGTQTIFMFQMRANEGFTHKDQLLSDMLQQGVLTVVLPRID